MFRRPRTLPSPDYAFLALSGIIIVVGLIALTSASGIVAFNKFGDSLFYVKRQVLFGILPGLCLFLIGFIVPHDLWRRWSSLLFVISLGLLGAVLIPGVGVAYAQGARSWFNIGGFSFQPAEFAKIALILYLAAWLSREHRDQRLFRGALIPFVFITGVVCILIALQPDIGTLGLVGAIALIVYFVSGAPLWHLAVLGGGAFAAFGGLIAIAPYRLARVLTFLSPDNDPSGAGYQLVQSLVAIGSGGLFGRGLGASRQKFQYLPEVAGDSIFSIIGEELGFVATAVFVLLFLAIAVRGWRIAKRAPDRFSQLVVVGVMSWLLVQAFFNMGSMVGLVPLTGVPLSLVSYGGTALTFLLFGLGIVANISRYTRT